MPERLPALTRDNTRRTLPVERACFAMMANRSLAPASKLYCYEQWLCEDVRIAGAGGLELRHLYRAMDFFAPQGAAGEVAVLPDRGPVLVRRRAHLLLHDHAPL